MNKKRNTLLATVLALIASTLVGIIASHSAYADTASIVEKWTFSQYYNCFQSELLNREIERDKASGRVSDIIFKLNSGVYDYNYLPSEGYYTRVNNLLGNINSINCRQVMNGIDNKISGILEQAGVAYNATWQKDLSETDSLMDKLGYKATDANTEYFFEIQMQVHERTVTQNLLTLITGPSIAERDYSSGTARIQGTRDSSGNISWQVIDSNFGNALKVKINNSNQMTVTLDTAGAFAGCLSTGDIKSNPIQLTNDIEQTKANIASEIQDWSAVENCSNTANTSADSLVLQTIDTTNTYSFSPDVSQLIDEGRGSTFVNDGSEATAKSSIQKLGRSLSSLELSEDEQYDLYNWYLNKAIPNFTLSSTGSLKCSNKKSDGSENGDLTPINLKNNGKWLKYYVNLDGVDISTEKYMDLQPNAVFRKISLQTVIDWMNSHSAEEISEEECAKSMASDSDSNLNPDTSSGVWDTTVADADTDEANCWNSAGAGGYLVCWVIQFAQHTITAVYENIITNFLEFRASFLEINSGNAVYTSWQIFQSFANIAFVIVLLIVIFSQLTGIGIDNLGIKRVLPKLIIAAVLINLSYIICMLFVDLSNIIGTGINSLFANIPVIANTDAELSTGSKVLSIGLEAAVAGAVGALGVVGIGLTGGVVVIPLLLGLITTLVGVLFFFIILGARQAAIVILIVVSPVAFACYMLPNTKSIFDKWLKMFEAMLLLFPICGLLMGGSAFASKILITLDQGFLGSLIAMLVGVVPFFFIPSLLRSSFSAIGNLGAKISGFGQNMGRRLQGAAANSDTVKDMNERMRAGIDRNGNLNALGRFRERMAKGDSRFSRVPGVQTMARRANSRAQAGRIKYLDKVAHEDRLNNLGPDYFNQYKRSQEMAEEKQQLNATIDNINDQTSKGENQAELFKMYDDAVASGDTFTARAVAEIAGRRKDTANAFMEKFKKDSIDKKYDGEKQREVASKVAKQIATGENSKNYRASNALGFEYASQIVKGDTADSYGDWVGDEQHVHDAIDHHITNGAEMYGQSNDSLRELARLATNHQAKNRDGSLKYEKDQNGNLTNVPIMHDDKNYLANLARRAEVEGRTNGTYDVTKEGSFERLKTLAPPTENSGDWQEGSSVNVNQQSSSGTNPTGSSAVESMREIKETGRHVATDDELLNIRNAIQREVDRNPQNAKLETMERLNSIDQELGRRQNARTNQQGSQNGQQGNQNGQQNNQNGQSGQNGQA